MNYRPRDWSEDAGHENGSYDNVCTSCKRVFTGHKRRVTCKECAHLFKFSPQPDFFAWRQGEEDAWKFTANRDEAFNSALTMKEVRIEPLYRLSMKQFIALRCWEIIELLRAEEANSVEIVCDNPEGCGTVKNPNCAIVCFGGWTNFEHRRFSGDTVLQCLEAALVEMQNPVHVVEAGLARR